MGVAYGTGSGNVGFGIGVPGRKTRNWNGSRRVEFRSMRDKGDGPHEDVRSVPSEESNKSGIGGEVSPGRMRVWYRTGRLTKVRIVDDINS